MDGRMDRIGCEEGEEQCDVCWRNQQMDLPALQLPALSPEIVRFSQEGLPRLERPEEGVVTSDVGFRDSGIGKSMSSQVQRSPVSEDGGFINQSPIPGRHLQDEMQDERPDELQDGLLDNLQDEMQDGSQDKMQDNIQIEAMFEKQQRERQWLVS